MKIREIEKEPCGKSKTTSRDIYIDEPQSILKLCGITIRFVRSGELRIRPRRIW